MGRVFTAEQVYNNEVPTPDDFKGALVGFSDAVDLGIDQGTVSGAIVYGSVAVQTHTRRSDFDAIIVCPGIHEFPVAQGVARQTFNAANQLVPIGIIAYTRPMLESGRHEIDRFFGRHITSTHRIVLGEDPADYIRYSDAPAAIIFDDYLRNKKRRLSSAYLNDSPATPEGTIGIQRMFELPVAVGRKLLHVMEELGKSEIPPLTTADKRWVGRQALMLFDQLHVGQGARHLLDMDRWHSRVLQAATERVIPAEMYQKHLDNFHQRLPQALAWLDHVDEAFHTVNGS